MDPEPKNPRLSMRDLAKMAGVSHSTVSLALKNHPRISQEVKQRIRDLAEQVGYRPDPMLSALSLYRLTKSDSPINAAIAWINGWPAPDELRKHKEFDCYWKGAYAAADKFGYRLEEFQVGRDMSPQRLHQILSTRGIRGLLLPPHHNNPGWKDFPWQEYSVVRFGRSLKEPNTHLVTADQVANTVLAVNAMRDRGYHRIGYVADEIHDSEHGILFSAGYMYACHNVPQKDRVPLLNIGGLDTQSYGKALLAWIKKHRVEAIFTNRGELMSVLAKLGVKVPDDVAVAVTSVLDTHADAGINQEPEEIGRVGFLMLNSLINDGSRGIPKIFRQILVEGSWVDGSSLPKLARK
jgi:DNA-binding LacI/PurR family transcriptional regulator